MRKPLCVALLLVTAAYAATGQTLTGQFEPIYQGRNLGAWVSQFGDNWLTPSNTPARVESLMAIRQIGANALPALLRMVREKKNGAGVGFGALGDTAKPAVPDLIPLLDHEDSDVRQLAANALSLIGPEAGQAVPALIKCLDDTNDFVRFRATRALGNIGKRPELVVPALIRKLERPDTLSMNTGNVIMSLGVFGPDAKAAVPILLRLLDSPNSMTRKLSANALKRIDPEASNKAGLK